MLLPGIYAKKHLFLLRDLYAMMDAHTVKKPSLSKDQDAQNQSNNVLTEE